MTAQKRLTSICWGAEVIFLPFLSMTSADTLVCPITSPLTRNVSVSSSDESGRDLTNNRSLLAFTDARISSKDDMESVTHSRDIMDDAALSFRFMTEKYLDRKGFLLPSKTRTYALTDLPIST